MSLESQIEALLFFKGKPVEIFALSRVLGVSKREIRKSLKNLKEELDDRGIVLVFSDSEAELVTSGEMSEIIESLRQDELAQSIGRAGVEVLAIVIYEGPITKPKIDYIRGVNSSTAIRTLLMRGLIERRKNQSNSRSFLYVPTIDILRHLGVGSVEEAPGYKEYREKLDKIKENGGGK